MSHNDADGTQTRSLHLQPRKHIAPRHEYMLNIPILHSHTTDSCVYQTNSHMSTPRAAHTTQNLNPKHTTFSPLNLPNTIALGPQKLRLTNPTPPPSVVYAKHGLSYATASCVSTIRQESHTTWFACCTHQSRLAPLSPDSNPSRPIAHMAYRSTRYS